MSSKGNCFKIDRSKSVEVSRFFGDGWTIWKGPRDGDGLEGDDDRDPRSCKVTQFSTRHLSYMFVSDKKDEKMTGEAWLKRQRMCANLPLDEFALGCFWGSYQNWPPMFKHRRQAARISDSTAVVYYITGVVFRDSKGKRHLAGFYHDDNGEPYQRLDEIGEINTHYSCGITIKC